WIALAEGGDAEATAWYEQAPPGSQCLGRLGQEEDHARGDREVVARLGELRSAGVHHVQFDVGQATGGRLGPGRLDHAGSEVDAGRPAGRPDRFGQREQGGATAAAEVEAALAGLGADLTDQALGDRGEPRYADVVVRRRGAIEDGRHSSAPLRR